MGQDLTELDVQDFLDVLDKDTPLEVVITAHIHIENVLNKFIDKRIPDEKEFRKIELDYEQKVRIAASLGLKTQLVQPLKFLGKIRNNFAHNLDAKINKSLMDGFFNTFPPKLKTEIKRVAKKNIKEYGLTKGSTYKNLGPKKKFGLLSFILFAIISKAEKVAKVENLTRTPL